MNLRALLKYVSDCNLRIPNINEFKFIFFSALDNINKQEFDMDMLIRIGAHGARIANLMFDSLTIQWLTQNPNRIKFKVACMLLSGYWLHSKSNLINSEKNLKLIQRIRMLLKPTFDMDFAMCFAICKLLYRHYNNNILISTSLKQIIIELKKIVLLQDYSREQTHELNELVNI